MSKPSVEEFSLMKSILNDLFILAQFGYVIQLRRECVVVPIGAAQHDGRLALIINIMLDENVPNCHKLCEFCINLRDNGKICVVGTLVLGFDRSEREQFDREFDINDPDLNDLILAYIVNTERRRLKSDIIRNEKMIKVFDNLIPVFK